jgi:uracil-DNA glycosylase
VKTLAEVYDEYRGDPRFDHLRTQDVVLVPGEGSPVPRIFIVGEAPGATENLQRRPFVGASGKALRSLIADSAGLDPTDWFLTNTVKYRPPGNRTPTHDEIASSVQYLREEYAAVGAPPVLVAVGNPARIALAAGMTGGTTSLAGKPYSVHGKWLWVMVHPRYALSNPSYRPVMEHHWDTMGDWFRTEFA